MSFTLAQVDQLLKPIKPSRVLRDNKGMSHVAAHDVRAHLTRVFGFGGWQKEIIDLECIRDEVKTVPAKGSKPAHDVPDVTYVCKLRLTIRDPEGNVVMATDDVGTGTSPNLPSHGDAHDFAAKNAVSYALKRAAIDLGDGFGLSLYNDGQTAAIVVDTLVKPTASPTAKAVADVQRNVPQQVDMGDGAPTRDVDITTGEIAEAVPTGEITVSGPVPTSGNVSVTVPVIAPGAVGDGTTDDTIAIQNAMNGASEIRGRIAKLGKAHGWTPDVLMADFADWTVDDVYPKGVSITEASVELLKEYLDVLPKRIEQS